MTVSEGGSRSVGTSKMELFMTIVNRQNPLTIATNSFFLAVATALDLIPRVAIMLC